jgi:NAD(P)-dependent dehydrogenase (short-subunit alcohol dehydrogenase family)
METKKVALVTGANKGIGFEIARQLGFKSYRVFMCGRNAGKIRQAGGMLTGEGHDVEPIVLDVTNLEAVKELADRFKSEGIEIAALVNNAGILKDRETNLLELSYGDLHDTMLTNAYAPFFITQFFIPVMEEGSRVVMVSSGAGTFCGELSTWAPAYATSKTTLNALTRQLAPVLAQRNIAINAVCPGWVQTSMGGEGATRSVKEGAETPVWLATEVDLKETGKFWRDKAEISW